MALDPARQAALEQARAVGLLRTCFDVEPSSAHIEALPFGVTARSGARGWIVSRSDDHAVLGGVLLWVDRHGPTEVDLVVDHHAGIHARRAEVVAPEIRVWRTEADRVVEAEVEPLAEPEPPPPGTERLEALLSEAGLEVVCEAGVVRGELAGLEVARLTDGPDGPRVEVGVGRFDREAGALLHPGRDALTALHDVIAQIEPHRREGAVGHPVNRLARERWLRATITADPTVLDLDDAVPIEPVPPRQSIREPGPASLLGRAGEARILVVCSVGVDLGLVPEIADLHRRHEPDGIRVVLPDRDRLPAPEQLLARMPVPTVVCSVPVPWSEV